MKKKRGYHFDSTLIFFQFDSLDSKNPENQAYPTLGVYVSSSHYFTKGICLASP